MSVFKISRRQLLVAASGAAAVAGTGTGGLWLGINKVNSLAYRTAVDRGSAFAPSVYLAIEPGGSVVIWLTRSEMGQGISTALPMLIADELDADWSSVRTEQAIAGPEYDYGQRFTAASSSITGEWIQFRRAGATARAMLIGAAAKLWQVPAAECTARQGVVYHRNSERKSSFSALTAEAAMQWAPIRPKLKSVDDFTLIGQPIQRLDIKDKITGKAIYGLDVELPDMLRAVIARPPTFSATLATMDDSALRDAPGIEHVVKLSNGVAVVAKSTFAAMRGRDALQCTWVPAQGPVVSDPDITAALQAHIQAEPHAIVRDEGEVPSDPQGEQVTTDYQVPFLAHACMEPMNCTVYIHDNQCEVWAPTQAPEGARRTASAISGLPLSQVRVHITQLGGGFGRRASQDFVAEAVELATHLDRPIQVLWTRDDDLRNANYRGASAHRLQATLDPTTKLPTAWSHRIVSAQFENPVPGQASGPAILGAIDQPYEFDNCRIDWCGVKLPIPTTIWRSVGYSSNTYAIESFVNELANTAGIDPLAYRLSLLENQPRLQECLLRVKKNSAWGTKNRHLGVACYNFAGTNVAQVAEVEGTGLKDFKVIKLWCVVNCGIAVNPDLVHAQIEGGMLDGLSTALYGGLHINQNAIEQSNFHDYPLLRMNAAPDVEVDLIQSNAPPSGVGEAGLPGTAPALVGALHSLTGRWQRKLPLTNTDGPSMDEV